MKKETKQNYLSPLIKTIMILSICFTGYSSFAQNERSASVNEYYKEYIAKNPNNQLVKYYLNNPQDVEAMQAMRYAVILDNPGDTPKSEIEKMQLKLNELTTGIESTQKLMDNGMTYEKAKESKTRRSNTAATQPRKEVKGQGQPIVAPALSAPGN